MECSILR